MEHEANALAVKPIRQQRTPTKTVRKAINHSISLGPLDQQQQATVVFFAEHCHLGSTLIAELHATWSELTSNVTRNLPACLTCLSTSHPQRYATCLVTMLVLPDCRGQSGIGIARTGSCSSARFRGGYEGMLILRPRQFPLRKSK